VSFRYFKGVFEIFGGCPGDIRWVFWRYLIGAWIYLMGVLEIIYGCPGDI